MNKQIVLQSELEKRINLLESIDPEYFNIVRKNRYIYTLSSVEFSKGMRVLDVGASPSHMAYVLKQCGCDVVGIDHEPGHIQPQIQNSISIIHANIEKDRLPFDDNTFDVILFTEVIEHLVYNPQKALKEIYRVLKPDGLVILTTPNAISLNKIIILLERKNIKWGGYKEFYKGSLYRRHNYEYTLEELKDLFNEAGFKIVKSQYLNYYSSLLPTINRFYLAPIRLLIVLFKKFFKSFRGDLFLIARKRL